MSRIRRSATAVAVATAVAFGAGCAATPRATPTAVPPSSASPSPPASPAPAAPPAEPFDVVSGLSAPWSMVTVGESVLISERNTARVFEWTAAQGLREVAVIDDVAAGGEGGLLGLAVAADELYVYATTVDGNRVQAYPLSGRSGSLSLGTPRTIIEGLPASANHNAGRIAFGPDGTLYVPVGDAGDPPAAQDPEQLAGKILRLTPDGDVPDDNPVAGSPVYSLGHRNVQGLAWASDGRLFASEFGQDTWDELNVIEPGGNYGWPVVEGAEGRSGFIDPVAQWTTDAASPSGIAIVADTVVIANLRGEVLRVAPVDDPTASVDLFADRYGRLRDVMIAPDGRLWVLTNNTDGRGDPREGDDRIVSVAVTDLSR